MPALQQRASDMSRIAPILEFIRMPKFSNYYHIVQLLSAHQLTVNQSNTTARWWRSVRTDHAPKLPPDFYSTATASRTDPCPDQQDIQVQNTRNKVTLLTPMSHQLPSTPGSNRPIWPLQSQPNAVHALCGLVQSSLQGPCSPSHGVAHRRCSRRGTAHGGPPGSASGRLGYDMLMGGSSRSPRHATARPSYSVLRTAAPGTSRDSFMHDATKCRAKARHLLSLYLQATRRLIGHTSRSEGMTLRT